MEITLETLNDRLDSVIDRLRELLNQRYLRYRDF